METGPVAQAEKSDEIDGDFTTPKGALATFLAASTARDLDLLSRCFADNAPREFDGLRQKTATQEQLDELAELMQDATITEVRIDDSGATAVVDVKLSRRDEHISMRMTDAGWKIVDF